MDHVSNIFTSCDFEDGSLLGCCAVVVWQKFTDVSEVLTASIIRAIYQTTRRNSPEDSHLHTHSRENLKSQFCDLIISLLNSVFP
jgi:hypothetical protein